MNEINLEYQYTVQGYVTFTVRVHSGEFSGASNFCVSKDGLQEAVAILGEICESMRGEYQVNDYDSDDYLLFRSRPYGHAVISGQLGGSFNPQYLTFELPLDQTELKRIAL